MRSFRYAPTPIDAKVVANVIPSIYEYEDYIFLNPDLSKLNRLEAAKHWENSGYASMRLCNKNQLIVVSEFGAEIILYACYYYYLYKSGLLFNNTITTYKGMRPFYYFIDPSNIIERDEPRKWIHISSRPLLINNTEHINVFNKKYWYPIPYNMQYKNNKFVFDKPLLIIENKYAIEWNKRPINYFSVDTLDSIFSKLSDIYTIVYIRPSNKNNILDKYSYSKDHNIILDDLNDYELIRNKYMNKILLFNDLLLQYNIEYNLLKLELFASCDKYISVQGGGTYLISFFYTRLLILHIEGNEINSGAYNGWYLDTEPGDKNIKVTRSYNDLIDNLNMFL